MLIVVFLRAVACVSIVCFALALLARGYSAPTVASFLAVLLAAAISVSEGLTRGVLPTKAS